jgi:hypothetical protein
MRGDEAGIRERLPGRGSVEALLEVRARVGLAHERVAAVPEQGDGDRPADRAVDVESAVGARERDVERVVHLERDPRRRGRRRGRGERERQYHEAEDEGEPSHGFLSGPSGFRRPPRAAQPTRSVSPLPPAAPIAASPQSKPPDVTRTTTGARSDESPAACAAGRAGRQATSPIAIR